MDWKDMERTTKFWEEFDVSEIIRKYDLEGIEIASLKEGSNNNRKKLAKLTREFKKLEPSEKLQKFGGLIKGYQSGINKLTERALKSEKVFMEVHSKLKSIENPVPVLNELKNREKNGKEVSVLLTENKDLKKQVEEFEREFEEIQNQEVTIRKLQEELENMRETNQRELEQEVFEDFELRIKQKNDEVEEFVRKYNHLEGLFTQSQEQMKKLRSELDLVRGNCNTLVSQSEILQEEISRLTLEKIQYKREAENLKSISDTTKTIKSLQIEGHQKDEKIEALEKTISMKESSIKQWSMKVKELENTIEENFRRNSSLKDELRLRPEEEEFKEVKERLETLEKLQFATSKISDDDGGTSSLSIEELLNQKIRYQQDKIISLNNKFQKVENEKENIEKLLVKTENLLKEKESLLKKLENDISNVQKSSRGVQESETSEQLSNYSESYNNMEGKEEMVLKIVTEQRDRYREKMNILEERNHELSETRRKISQKYHQLQDDNIKLYEKIRYIETYSTPQSTANETIIQIDGLHSLSKSKENEKIEEKYQKLYEDNINKGFNPYNQFIEREKKTQFKKLTALEKITLVTTGKMLRHKYGRMFLFFYTISLHMLVFVMCYYFQTYRF